MRAMLIGAALAAAACGGSDGGSSGTPPPACTAASATATTSVSLSGARFVPSCVKVAPGAAVTFTNDDSDPYGAALHTVTADGQAPSFDSGPLSAGEHFTHTFPSAGTVAIHCSYHGAMGMRATIFVQ